MRTALSFDGIAPALRGGAMSVLISLLFLACQFKNGPVPVADAGVPPGSRADGGAASGHTDAAPTPNLDAAPPPLDADSSSGPFTREDAGAVGDAGDPDAESPPDVPDSGPQVGGLKCGDVFCAFATAPVEPCCTAEADVEHGAAREADRCGLNFAATGADYFADYCWQRDQPGVVDDSCPAVSVDLRSEEPGCCTDQGVCGSLNSDSSLGCHVDPYASAEQSCGPDSVEPDGGAVDECDMRGVFAVRMEVDMVWGGRSGGLWDLTDDGRGSLRIDMLASFEEIEAGTLDMQGTIKPCGVELPTFFSTSLCEAYQPIFPNAMWESDKMPEFPLRGHLSCLEPGCIASLEAQTVLLGIELDNPEAPWPTAMQTPDVTCPSGEGMECFPDHDGDRRPGLTVQLAKQGMAEGGTGCTRDGYDLRGAPLRSSIAAIFGGVRRTDRVLLGVRMRVGGSFALAGDECTTGSGSGIAEFVNSRGWGCVVQQGTYYYPNGERAGANEPCTAQEAAFMDANLPVYGILPIGETPPDNLEVANTAASLGPRVSMVRLGDLDADVTCADVRAAAHP